MGQNVSKRGSYTPGKTKNTEVAWPTADTSNGTNNSLELNHKADSDHVTGDASFSSPTTSAVTVTSSSTPAGKTERRKRFRVSFPLKRTQSGHWSRRRKTLQNGGSSVSGHEFNHVASPETAGTADTNKTDVKVEDTPVPRATTRSSGRRRSQRSPSRKKKKGKQSSTSDKKKKGKETTSDVRDDMAEAGVHEMIKKERGVLQEAPDEDISPTQQQQVKDLDKVAVNVVKATVHNGPESVHADRRNMYLIPAGSLEGNRENAFVKSNGVSPEKNVKLSTADDGIPAGSGNAPAKDYSCRIIGSLPEWSEKGAFDHTPQTDFEAKMQSVSGKDVSLQYMNGSLPATVNSSGLSSDALTQSATLQTGVEDSRREVNTDQRMQEFAVEPVYLSVTEASRSAAFIDHSVNGTSISIPSVDLSAKGTSTDISSVGFYPDMESVDLVPMTPFENVYQHTKTMEGERSVDLCPSTDYVTIYSTAHCGDLSSSTDYVDHYPTAHSGDLSPSTDYVDHYTTAHSGDLSPSTDYVDHYPTAHSGDLSPSTDYVDHYTTAHSGDLSPSTDYVDHYPTAHSGDLSSSTDYVDHYQTPHSGKLSSSIDYVDHYPIAHSGDLSSSTDYVDHCPTARSGDLSSSTDYVDHYPIVYCGDLSSSTDYVDHYPTPHCGDLSSSTDYVDHYPTAHSGDLSSSTDYVDHYPAAHSGDLSSSTDYVDHYSTAHSGDLSPSTDYLDLSPTTHFGKMTNFVDASQSVERSQKISSVDLASVTSHVDFALTTRSVHHSPFTPAVDICPVTPSADLIPAAFSADIPQNEETSKAKSSNANFAVTQSAERIPASPFAQSNLATSSADLSFNMETSKSTPSVHTPSSVNSLRAIDSPEINFTTPNTNVSLPQKLTKVSDNEFSSICLESPTFDDTASLEGHVHAEHSRIPSPLNLSPFYQSPKVEERTGSTGNNLLSPQGSGDNTYSGVSFPLEVSIPNEESSLHPDFFNGELPRVLLPLDQAIENWEPCNMSLPSGGYSVNDKLAGKLSPHYCASGKVKTSVTPIPLQLDSVNGDTPGTTLPLDLDSIKGDIPNGSLPLDLDYTSSQIPDASLPLDIDSINGEIPYVSLPPHLDSANDRHRISPSSLDHSRVNGEISNVLSPQGTGPVNGELTGLAPSPPSSSFADVLSKEFQPGDKLKAQKLSKVSLPLNLGPSTDHHEAILPLDLGSNVQHHEAILPLDLGSNVQNHEAILPLDLGSNAQNREAILPLDLASSTQNNEAILPLDLASHVEHQEALLVLATGSARDKHCRVPSPLGLADYDSLASNEFLPLDDGLLNENSTDLSPSLQDGCAKTSNASLLTDPPSSLANPGVPYSKSTMADFWYDECQQTSDRILASLVSAKSENQLNVCTDTSRQTVAEVELQEKMEQGWKSLPDDMPMFRKEPALNMNNQRLDWNACEVDGIHKGYRQPDVPVAKQTNIDAYLQTSPENEEEIARKAVEFAITAALCSVTTPPCYNTAEVDVTSEKSEVGDQFEKPVLDLENGAEKVQAVKEKELDTISLETGQADIHKHDLNLPKTEQDTKQEIETNEHNVAGKTDKERSPVKHIRKVQRKLTDWFHKYDKTSRSIVTQKAGTINPRAAISETSHPISSENSVMLITKEEMEDIFDRETETSRKIISSSPSASDKVRLDLDIHKKPEVDADWLTSNQSHNEPCTPHRPITLSSCNHTTSPSSPEGDGSNVLKKINLGSRLRTAVLRKKSTGSPDGSQDGKRVSLTRPHSLGPKDLSPSLNLSPRDLPATCSVNVKGYGNSLADPIQDNQMSSNHVKHETAPQIPSDTSSRDFHNSFRHDTLVDASGLDYRMFQIDTDNQIQTSRSIAERETGSRMLNMGFNNSPKVDSNNSPVEDSSNSPIIDSNNSPVKDSSNGSIPDTLTSTEKINNRICQIDSSHECQTTRNQLQPEVTSQLQPGNSFNKSFIREIQTDSSRITNTMLKMDAHNEIQIVSSYEEEETIEIDTPSEYFKTTRAPETLTNSNEDVNILFPANVSHKFHTMAIHLGQDISQPELKTPNLDSDNSYTSKVLPNTAKDVTRLYQIDVKQEFQRTTSHSVLKPASTLQNESDLPKLDIKDNWVQENSSALPIMPCVNSLEDSSLNSFEYHATISEASTKTIPEIEENSTIHMNSSQTHCHENKINSRQGVSINGDAAQNSITPTYASDTGISCDMSPLHALNDDVVYCDEVTAFGSGVEVNCDSSTLNASNALLSCDSITSSESEVGINSDKSTFNESRTGISFDKLVSCGPEAELNRKMAVLPKSDAELLFDKLISSETEVALNFDKTVSKPEKEFTHGKPVLFQSASGLNSHEHAVPVLESTICDKIAPSETAIDQMVVSPSAGGINCYKVVMSGPEMGCPSTNPVVYGEEDGVNYDKTCLSMTVAEAGCDKTILSEDEINCDKTTLPEDENNYDKIIWSESEINCDKIILSKVDTKIYCDKPILSTLDTKVDCQKTSLSENEITCDKTILSSRDVTVKCHNTILSDATTTIICDKTISPESKTTRNCDKTIVFGINHNRNGSQNQEIVSIKDDHVPQERMTRHVPTEQVKMNSMINQTLHDQEIGTIAIEYIPPNHTTGQVPTELARNITDKFHDNKIGTIIDHYVSPAHTTEQVPAEVAKMNSIIIENSKQASNPDIINRADYSIGSSATRQTKGNKHELSYPTSSNENYSPTKSVLNLSGPILSKSTSILSATTKESGIASFPVNSSETLAHSFHKNGQDSWSQQLHPTVTGSAKESVLSEVTLVVLGDQNFRQVAVGDHLQVKVNEKICVDKFVSSRVRTVAEYYIGIISDHNEQRPETEVTQGGHDNGVFNEARGSSLANGDNSDSETSDAINGSTSCQKGI